MRISRRVRAAKRRKKERRRDEQSLYYIIERDLDTEAIFREHEGWERQLSLDGGTVDYALKYGKHVFGIEVKYDFPSPKHFDQVVDQYGRYFEATFLAYPSDRVGEALYIKEKQSYEEVGLISIALYRSHLIRRAAMEKKEDSSEILNHFSERVYWQNIRKNEIGVPRTSKRIVELVLNDTINLEQKDWEFLALLWASEIATGVFKYHRYVNLKQRAKDLGWTVPYYQALTYTSLVETRSYGDTTWLYILSDAASYYKKELEEKMSEELGNGTMTRIRKIAEKWKNHHRERQKEEIASYISK